MENCIVDRSTLLPWGVRLVAILLLIGGGLCAGLPRRATAQESAAAKRFNWAAPRLIPVTVEVRDRSVVLQAEDSRVTLNGSLFKIDAGAAVSTKWKREMVGQFHVFSLELQVEQPTLVKNVEWFAGQWTGVDKTVVHRTDLQDNALFLRKGNVSFFIALDFPYSKITPASVAYPANADLAAGESHACHTISVAACKLSGIRVREFDRGEIEAVSAYVEDRFPMRFERPMYLTSSITNRMTYAMDGLIFYSMYDNPTVGLSPELVAEDIRVCHEVGIEYLQVFEGVFDWPDEVKTAESLQSLMEIAKPLSVRVGDYVVPGGPYVAHYNYENRRIERPEWRIQRPDGREGELCLGCPEYLKFLIDKLAAHNRKYGEEMICLDGLAIEPCHNPHHRHPVGDVYQQVRGLVSLCETLNAISPDYMVWSNSGNFISFMPKLIWCNPNVYLADPVLRTYGPDLNCLKTLGDNRRQQMVSIHDQYSIPFRSYCNYEYYLSPRSRVHDGKMWKYSFMQGLAVTPNIASGELRTFLNRLPSAQRAECVAFMRHWLAFIRDHFDVWKRTAIVGDEPSIGAGEIYTHIQDDHGFICLVNQNPFPRTVRFALDASIGLARGELFDLCEVYPKICPIIEQALPCASSGQELTCQLPPESVRFIEIKPAVAPADTLVVLGLPARVKKNGTGYSVKVSSPQGELVTLGLVLPVGQAIETVSASREPTVTAYTFPVSARIVEQSGNVARVDVQFPRARAPRELTQWTVSPGDTMVQLPMIGKCAFLGGLVYNAFAEDYEVQLDITTRPEATVGSLPPLVAPVEPEAALLPAAPKQTFTTTFNLPFIERAAFGCLTDASDDTVLELAFDKPAPFKSMAARINGQPVEVRKYTYPRRGDFCSYYVELTGVVDPGRIELSVEIEWE